MNKQLGRKVPSDVELNALVYSAMKTFAPLPSFTAWDVTNTVRKASPEFEVEHERVRTVVHAVMEALIVTNPGYWEYETREYVSPTDFTRQAARTYVNRTLFVAQKDELPANIDDIKQLAQSTDSDASIYIIKVY